MRKTCKNDILEYLNLQPGWVSKGEICEQIQGYLPETIGRACRDLAEEGKIQVDYYKGKKKQKLARYAANNTPPPKKLVKEVEFVDTPTGRIARITEIYK